MSHFTVLVTNTNVASVDEQLAPFDENKDLPLHIYKTRKDIIESGRKDAQRAKDKLAEYNADPEEYEKGCSNPRHLEWLKNEAPVEAAKLDDEDALYEIGVKWYRMDAEDEDNNIKIDDNGNVWATWNENAKWDWYQVGGRWAGFFTAKEGAEDTERGNNGLMESNRSEAGVDVIKVKDIDWDAMEAEEKERRAKAYDEENAKEEKDRFWWYDNRDEVLKMNKEEFVNRPVHQSTFAVLHNGQWYEKGDMGWWGMVSNEKEQDKWDEEFEKLIKGLSPDTEVAVVDCHI